MRALSVSLWVLRKGLVIIRYIFWRGKGEEGGDEDRIRCWLVGIGAGTREEDYGISPQCFIILVACNTGEG